jgi:multimeric flavodoxin WrbA
MRVFMFLFFFRIGTFFSYRFFTASGFLGYPLRLLCFIPNSRRAFILQELYNPQYLATTGIIFRTKRLIFLSTLEGKMKITVFSGSHKGREGNTLIMVEEFLKGAEEAGAETENIILAEKKIRYCRGEFECWLKTPGSCTMRDDMDELILKFMASDIVVFACPVYFDNVPVLMKKFIERLSPVLLPYFEEDENGEYRHAKRYEKYPKIAVISNAGLPGQTNFEVERVFFRRLARTFHTELIAEIYRGEGEIFRGKDNFILKPLLGKYQKLLRAAGKEFVENQKLSEKTISELEKPIIPASLYIMFGNQQWDQLIDDSSKK